MDITCESVLGDYKKQLGFRSLGYTYQVLAMCYKKTLKLFVLQLVWQRIEKCAGLNEYGVVSLVRGVHVPKATPHSRLITRPSRQPHESFEHLQELLRSISTTTTTIQRIPLHFQRRIAERIFQQGQNRQRLYQLRNVETCKVSAGAQIPFFVCLSC